MSAESMMIEQIEDLLRTSGWAQGKGLDEYGRFCLWGAAVHVRHGVSHQVYNNVGKLVCDAIRARASTELLACMNTGLLPEQVQPWYSVMRFNDNPGTTLEDVMLALKQAREAAELSS